MIRPFVLFSLLLATTKVFASPIIIRDERVQDLGSTPVLGRGYTIATNTFQSACLKEVKLTEPSYDFQYKFEQIDSSSAKTAKSSSSAKVEASYFFVKAHVEASAQASAATKKTQQHVLVTLNMDSYYGSVDESDTHLGESAGDLLKKGDLPGFFASCGSYYVRGISRNSKYVAIFSFESVDTTTDTVFKAQLEASVKQFYPGVSAGAGVSQSGEFHTEASKRKLTITARGWGLGKNADATLISYDLETFKQAIKQAFISMQNPLTGRVVAVELTPWVENTDFQDLVDLKTDQKGADGKAILLYEKKDILNFNAEFLAEIERASRNKLNTYYKARLCRDTIRSNWYGEGGKLMKDFADRNVRNNRTGEKGIPVSDLDKEISDAKIQGLFDDYKKFIYDGGGATDCIKALLAGKGGAAAAGGAAATPVEGEGRGLFTQRYTDVPVCTGLVTRFPASVSAKVEDHCMPELEQ